MIYNNQNNGFAEYNNESELEKLKKESNLKTFFIVILIALTIISTSLLVYLSCTVYKTTEKMNSMININRIETSDNDRLNDLFTKLSQIDLYYKMFYVGDIDYDNLKKISFLGVV